MHETTTKQKPETPHNSHKHMHKQISPLLLSLALLFTAVLAEARKGKRSNNDKACELHLKMTQDECSALPPRCDAVWIGGCAGVIDGRGGCQYRKKRCPMFQCPNTCKAAGCEWDVTKGSCVLKLNTCLPLQTICNPGRRVLDVEE